jgi:pimeloyl-ACP methyl ester carboxylesterase
VTIVGNDERIGHWTKPSAEREYLEIYDALREEQFSDADVLDVDTRYGTTRVYHRRGSGVPIVMVPGAGAPSLMWAPLLNELDGCDAYVLDIVGDAGRSVQRTPMPQRDDLSHWLDDVLDGLTLDRVHVVGASYGGWVALTYAGHARERVVSIALLEPVLGKLRAWFWVHGLLTGLALLLPSGLRRRAANGLHMQALVVDDKRPRRLGFLAQTKYRRGFPKFRPVDDNELASIPVPALVLLGRHSQVHKGAEMLARIRAVAPATVDASIIEDAGHALPFDQSAEIAPRVRSFLAQSPNISK